MSKSDDEKPGIPLSKVLAVGKAALEYSAAEKEVSQGRFEAKLADGTVIIYQVELDLR
jgi:glutaredoxin 2